MNDINPALLTSVLKIVGPEGLAVRDFKRSVWLGRKFGFGPNDHLRACEILTEQGFLSVVNEVLVLEGFLPVDWLVQSIAAGDEEACGLVDQFPERFWKFDVDQTVLQDIGKAGEDFVIQSLRESVDQNLWSRIRHMSITNDALGFDISAPSRFDSSRDVLLEVKTSFRPGPKVRFHLTRNEARVGGARNNWFLVFVRNSSLGFQLVGHLTFGDVNTLLPSDASAEFMWSEAIGSIDQADLRPGLP
jgi:hypothetical protein